MLKSQSIFFCLDMHEYIAEHRVGTLKYVVGKGILSEELSELYELDDLGIHRLL